MRQKPFLNTREPAVANKFYPGKEKELRDLLESIQRTEASSINNEYAQKQIIGGVVPHAGYIYSGYEAMHFFQNIQQSAQKFDTIIIIQPNHHMSGHNYSTDSCAYWRTPLGRVKVDAEFASKLNMPFSEKDHQFEHSGEVMVPFLQYFLDYSFQIVPITFNIQNYQNAQNIAQAIFDANSELGKNILIIASSDFSHFVSPETGEQLDNLALEQIQSFNSKGLEEEVVKNRLSICGYGPIMALMEYARLSASAPHCDILKKGNSAKTFPSNEVVDYVSMIFYENNNQ